LVGYKKSSFVLPDILKNALILVCNVKKYFWSWSVT